MVRGSRIGVALALLAMTACGDEDGPAECERDFDCPVGQVCGNDGLCTDAAPGQEKEFGEVELDFSTDADTYLLAVYALPTGAEAASFDYVSFSIDQGGTPAGALRWEATPSEPEPRVDAEYWADRIAFEAQRRAGIESVVRDLRAERLSFGSRAVPKAACTSACSATEFCFPGQTTCSEAGNLTFTTNAELNSVRAVGTVETNPAKPGPKVRVKVLVDGLDTTNDENAKAAARDFADAASTVLDAFGESSHGSALDRNEDGAIAVVFTSRVAEVGTSIVGFFEFRDFMDAGATSGGIAATGNEADLLWAQVPTKWREGCTTGDPCPDTITHELAVGTLAHEYTHLITYARRVHTAGTAAQNEVLWLDEGIAHMMEDATGWGGSNIGVVVEAFADSNWPNTLLAGPPGDALRSDQPAQRGMAYLYLRYLVEQRASGAASAADVGITLPGELIKDSELGFLHPAIANHGADGFWGWLLATFATEHPDVAESAAHADDYLPVANHDLTGQPVGVNPNGTYVDARNATRDLSSDDITDDMDLATTEFPFGSEIGVSGSMLFKVISSETGTTTLTGTGPAEVDLQMRAIRVW